MTEEDEHTLQLSLVGFRTMPLAMQKAFLCGALDEFCGLAKDGGIDRVTAGQILFRAQLVASFLNLPQPGQLKMVEHA